MSFNTGLSGLNASSKNLDVIGHNIANANTSGMKAGRAEFSEVYASSLGASGGTNGGIGVTVATVAQMFSQGNLKVTGNNLDMAVNGEGFFKVSMTDGSTAYTRNGEFKLDKSGYIVTNNGARLQGYATDTEGKRTTVVTSDIQLPTGSVVAPKATGTDPLLPGVFLTANLDASVAVQTPPAIAAVGAALDPTHKSSGTALNVFDEQGNALPLQIYFIKNAANTWTAVTSLDGDTVHQNLGTVTFGADGIPTASTLVDINIAADDFAPGIPSAALTFPLDIGDATDGWTLTQYGSNFSVFDLKQDGYAPGEMSSITIGENGVITARYSNGTSQAAGQIGLTTFRNVQGLQPVNGGYWQSTFSSGDPVAGAPQEGRLGLIRSGALEESNVDMTAELVNMIVAQRAYQANAQTIKTQDQILSTLVNLR